MQDIVSELPERFFVSEIIRKHVFLQYMQEVPYNVAGDAPCGVALYCVLPWLDWVASGCTQSCSCKRGRHTSTASPSMCRPTLWSPQAA